MRQKPLSRKSKTGTVTLCVAWGMLSAVAGLQCFIGLGGVPNAGGNGENGPGGEKVSLGTDPTPLTGNAEAADSTLPSGLASASAASAGSSVTSAEPAGNLPPAEWEPEGPPIPHLGSLENLAGVNLAPPPKDPFGPEIEVPAPPTSPGVVSPISPLEQPISEDTGSGPLASSAQPEGTAGGKADAVAAAAAPTLDAPITDEVILAELEKGLFHKEKADTLTAITHLRAAYELQPDHPRLMYELAHTYDLMGLEKRSAPLWRSLAALGKAAGDYAKLTELRVQQSPELAVPMPSAPPAASGMPAEDFIAGPPSPRPAEAKPIAASFVNTHAPAGASVEKPAKQLQFTDVKLVKDAKERAGERQQLYFSLKKNNTESVAVEDITLVVQFFETLNGKKIDRSQLPEEPQTYQLAAPLDWPNGENEPLQVDYFQPTMSPQEILKFGHRTYFGHVLQIYWKGQLQDVVADPPELLPLSSEIPLEAPTAPHADALLATANANAAGSAAGAASQANSRTGAQGPAGVDASLFPPLGPAIGVPVPSAPPPQTAPESLPPTPPRIPDVLE